MGYNAFLSPQIFREDYQMSGNVLGRRRTSTKQRRGVVKDASYQGSNPGSIAWLTIGPEKNSAPCTSVLIALRRGE